VADPAASASSSAASPLNGKRVVVTRAVAQSSELFEKLEQRGAIPTSLPLVSFSAPEDYAPLDAALRRWNEFDWVLFTSANAVLSVIGRSASSRISIRRTGDRPRVATVGPATNDEATRAGLSVNHVAKTHLGIALAEEFGPQVRDKNVFLPRSDRANPDLPAALKRLGARVTEVVAYRTLPPSDVDGNHATSVIGHESDAAVFFSPSAVHNLANLIGKQSLSALQDKIVFAAVGPVTAATLRECGIRRIVVAVDTTAGAVVEALETHFAASASSTAGQKPVAGAKHG
jgi:uroporphyrinogen III methyltransferase / synthase